MVVNASNIAKNLKWLSKHAIEGVLIKDVSDFVGLLTGAGPESKAFKQNFGY